MIEIRPFNAPGSEDDCWTSDIISSESDWLVGLSIEIATIQTEISPEWIDEIKSFIYYLDSNLHEIKHRLFNFYEQSSEWLAEECEQWACEMPEISTIETLWDTLENFLIYYKDSFHGGPNVSLLADCEWKPNGGIEFKFEDGVIGYVGQQT